MFELHLETPENDMGCVTANHFTAVRFNHDLHNVLDGMGNAKSVIELFLKTLSLEEPEHFALQVCVDIFDAVHIGLFELIDTFEFANEIKYGNYDKFWMDFLEKERERGRSVFS